MIWLSSGRSLSVLRARFGQARMGHHRIKLRSRVVNVRTKWLQRAGWTTTTKKTTFKRSLIGCIVKKFCLQIALLVLSYSTKLCMNTSGITSHQNHAGSSNSSPPLLCVQLLRLFDVFLDDLLAFGNPFVTIGCCIIKVLITWYTKYSTRF